MLRNRDGVLETFRGATPLSEIAARLDDLGRARDLEDVLECARIRYLAPCDARRLEVADCSFDLQTSFTVLEHIPEDVLVEILVEIRRVLDVDGLALNHVDMSDHFAHDDHAISFVNFLRYSERAWRFIAGNRYGFHNRMRVDELQAAFVRAGHEIRWWKTYVDGRSEHEIRNGLPLCQRFRDKPVEVLAASAARVVSR
jgi:SAM-dependent methyltransferase